MSLTPPTIHRHHGWDRHHQPAVRVTSGERIRLETNDASDGQFTPRTTADQLDTFDATRVNPLTGPIFVAGAEPGDGLAVHIHSVSTGSWGWTASTTGFGLLGDHFVDPLYYVWDLSGSTTSFLGVADVPIRPFVGCIGVAPAQPGPHSVVPPRNVGGNLDLRDLGAGSTIILPVEVPGALLSVGDVHAAQGDGEVCGSAIETTGTVELSVELLPGTAPPSPMVETSDPDRHPPDRGSLMTTGVGADLYDAARDAVLSMTELLGRRLGIDTGQAYLLCSVVGNLRIVEIVDDPNRVVAFQVPKAVLSG